MKNAVLIIEGADNISEALLLACAERPIDGLNFYVAKTSQAANKILQERDDIAAVITAGSNGLELKLLDGIDAPANLIELQALLSPTEDAAIEPDPAPPPDDTEEIESHIKYRRDRDDRDEVCKDAVCHRDVSHYSSKSGILRAVDLDVKKNPTPNNIEEILNLLESHGILRAEKHHSHGHCSRHEDYANKITELSVRIERLSKDVDSIIVDIKNVNSAIDNCPLKRSLINEALKTKDDEIKSGRGCSKTIIVALIGFLGVLATALSGLLGKIFEIVLEYYSKLGG